MKVHSTNYFNAFLSVAEDCPVSVAEEPPEREPKTAARIAFEMLIHSPYEHTSDDVLFAANGARRGLARAEFFAKGQPCFRAFALSKRYGWGVHFDAQGRVALLARQSAEYAALAADASLKQLLAMRNQRA